jgi:hypothetical protein
MKGWVSVVGAAFLMGSARTSSAQQARGAVSLDLDPCVAVDADEVRRIASVEIDELLPSSKTTTPEQTTKVTLRCKPLRLRADSGEQIVVLHVDNPVTGKTLTRTVDLSASSASARSRLVVLATAELISASWTEVEAAPPQPAPEVVTVPVVGARPAVVTTKRPTVSPLRLMLAVELRGWLPKTAPALGVGVRAVYLRPTGIGWSVDLLGDHGSRSLVQGVVAFDTVSLGGALFVHRSWSLASLRAGPGVRFGIARLSGTPGSDAVEGGSVVGPWGGPTLNAIASIQPARSLVFELATEMGYGLAAVHGLAARFKTSTPFGERKVALSTPWATVAPSFGGAFCEHRHGATCLLKASW